MVNCTKFDSIMQVIYIDKEKEWTKDTFDVPTEINNQHKFSVILEINFQLCTERSIM